jgi:hypothetical protein
MSLVGFFCKKDCTFAGTLSGLGQQDTKSLSLKKNPNFLWLI